MRLQQLFDHPGAHAGLDRHDPFDDQLLVRDFVLAESFFSLFANGSQMPLARNTPQNVATNAPAMPSPTFSGCDSCAIVAISPNTAPMMPKVGAKTPACVHQPWPILCRSFIARDLGVQRLLQRFGVGAVDRELDALAEERVLDALRLFFEGEEAFGAGPVGEHDDLVDRLARRVVFFALQRLLDVLAEVLGGFERERGDRRADASRRPR